MTPEEKERLFTLLERIAVSLEKSRGLAPKPPKKRKRARPQVNAARTVEPTELDRERARQALRRAGFMKSGR